MPLINRVGGGSADLQSGKSATPTTSAKTYFPDAGYDGFSNFKVNAIPSEYVKPSATQTAQTITPGTSDKSIAAGTYCSGKQTIKGDADLVKENIKSGVEIFGVMGTHRGGKTYYGTAVGSLDTSLTSQGNVIKIPIESNDVNVRPTSVTIQRVSAEDGQGGVICVSYYNNSCYGVIATQNDANSIQHEGLVGLMSFYWNGNNLYIEYEGSILNGLTYHYSVSYD